MQHPGEHEVNFRGLLEQNIDGALPVTFNIIRSVAGLALPMRCNIVQNLSIGSCSYSDLCKDVFRDILGNSPLNCHPALAQWGIDCTCPFNIPAQTLDGSIAFLINISEENLIGPIYAAGDYDFTIQINNNRGQHVACFRFLYSIFKRPLDSK